MDDEQGEKRLKIVSLASYYHDLKRRGEPYPDRMQRWPVQKPPCHERMDELDGVKRLFEGWKDASE